MITAFTIHLTHFRIMFHFYRSLKLEVVFATNKKINKIKTQQKSNMFGTEYKKLDCPYLRHCFKVFWLALCEKIGSYFWSEYRKIRTRNNSVYGYFSRSVVLPLISMSEQYLEPSRTSTIANSIKADQSYPCLSYSFIYIIILM